jgi:hypothetical protein
VEDAVAAAADALKQARIAATAEGHGGGGACGGVGEAEVTEQLLALVDETIDDEARARAQRRLARVEEDFDHVRVSA